MKRIIIYRKRFTALLILMGFCYLNTNAQDNKASINFERLSDRVLLVWGGDIYKDQVAAIATEKGVVIIDAGKAPSLTKEYRKIIEMQLGRNDFTYLINTHYHFDHTSGNQIFGEAKIIAHQKTPDKMREWHTQIQSFVEARRNNQMLRWENEFKEAEPGSEQWIRLNDYLSTGEAMLDDYENNYILSLPELTFNDLMTLELGDITLRLYYFGEGRHTGDDIIVFCPEEKILFTGDLFYKGSYGFAYHPNLEVERWIHVLDQIFIEENTIDWVYDCHNGAMSGDYLALYHRYMKDIWESLLAAKEDGLTYESVIKKYSYKNRFSYISKSGLEPQVLERGHADNLKFTWEYINNR